MSIRDKKGKSIIPLLIILLIIIVVVIMGIRIANNLMQEESVETLNTNMLLIQAKCKVAADKENIKEQETENETRKELAKGKKGMLISDIIDNEKIKGLIEKNVITAEEKYYLLSQEDFNSLDIQDVNAEDGYLFNYDTEEVIYVKGILYEGTVIYKLSDLKEFL